MMDERKLFQKRELRLSEIQFEERGIYTCKAENLLGSVQSAVNVTVQGMYEFMCECLWDRMKVKVKQHMCSLSHFIHFLISPHS